MTIMCQMFWALGNRGEEPEQAFPEGNLHILQKRKLMVGLNTAGGSRPGFQDLRATWLWAAPWVSWSSWVGPLVGFLAERAAWASPLPCPAGIPPPGRPTRGILHVRPAPP